MRVPPATDPAFAAAAHLAEQRGGPAHLYVEHRGRVVVDARLGVGAHAQFWPFSVSKLWLAALIWRLHDDGVLDVDAPVAEYWPEFAAAAPSAPAKASITVREVLQHRSGLPRVGGTLTEVVTMTNWRAATGNIARATPTRAAPGEHRPPQYEWLAWGFMLAEVALGATDTRDLQAPLDARILTPLDARDTTVRLPRTDDWRAVPFRAVGPAMIPTTLVLNSARVRRACIPAGGIWTTAGDLAALLHALNAERPLLSNATLRQLRTPSNHGEFDRYAGGKTWWANGLQLGHPGRRWWRASAFGRRSTEHTFGHNGSNASIAWHDPDRALTFIYLSGVLSAYPHNRRWLMRLEDEAFRAAEVG